MGSKKKTIVIFFAAALLLMLLLTGCASDETATPEEPVVEEPTEGEPEVEEPEAEPVTITYWHTMSDPETEQLEKVVAAFEAANPGITVETTRFAYDDFKPALLTGLAGDEAPDTARMDIAWVSEFADQGALMQLDGVMPGFEEIAAGTFPGPLSTNYWQGHYYGLPQNTNTQVLLWNRADYDAAGLSEPPETMEEFAEVACALTSGEEQYGYALGGTYFWAPAPIFYAMGGKIVDEEITTASGYINGEESVAAFSLLTDLFEQGCISPNLLGGGIGTADGHATGLYANIIDGPWMVDIYKGNYPDFEVNFALIPTGPDGTTSSVVGGEDVVVFEGTEQAEAAMKWAAYLLSEESQLMMAEVGVIPTLESVIGNESLPEYFGVFLEQLQTAQARVPHPSWSDMDNAINNAFQRMLRGEQTSQEALDQAAMEIDALLAGEPMPEPEPEVEAEPVTITYWHTMSDPETEQLEKVVAAFEAANPGITVETTRFAYDDFKPALLTGLAGDEAPDTARMDIAWVSEFADQGALMQLDGVMPGFEEIAAGTFPGPLSTNYWQGHYYGLPQNTNTQVLLWNRADYDAAGLSEPPETMEEFAEVACALTSGEEQYGYALGGTYFWAPAPIFYAMGGKIVDEEITTASGYINGEESVAAFSLLTDLFEQGCISPNLLGGGIGTADGHATGLYANIIDGPWMVDIYKGNYPDFEVNFALIPTGPDGTTSSVVGGEDVVVFEGTEQAEAAMKWAAYLLSEESQLMMAEVGVIPTLESVIGNESLPEYFGVFLEQLQTAQARVPHPSWSDMDNAINNAFQRMLRGEQTPQEALDQAAGEINTLLE